MRFDNDLYKEGMKTIEDYMADSYSFDDYSYEVEGGINLKVLDKVRIISTLSSLISDREKELEKGIELVNKYFDGKQITFYRGDTALGSIVYSAKSGFDAYPIFKEHPILVNVLSSRLIGYVSKNSLGCMVREKAKATE